MRVLTANGPTGGDLNDVERLDTVLASADIVAADSYAATLFDLSGADIPYVQAGTTWAWARWTWRRSRSASSSVVTRAHPSRRAR